MGPILHVRPQMTRAKTIIFIVATSMIVVAIALSFTNYGRTTYSSIAAPYPNEWLRIKPGMISDDARKLLGEPWADGRDLKSLDRWRRNRIGIELHLDIWFDRENNGSAVIARVVRWKHFLGDDFDEHADPPWP